MITITITGENKEELFQDVSTLFYVFSTDNSEALDHHLEKSIIEEMKILFSEKAKKNKKEVEKLLTELNVRKITDIPRDKYSGVIERLRKI